MEEAWLGSLHTNQTEEVQNIKSVPLNIAKIVLLVLATIAISELMYGFNIGSQNIIMIYLLAVLLISAITPGYIYGILAAVICTFSYDFLVTNPRMGFSLTIRLPVTMFIMMLVTVTASAITARIKEKAIVAAMREHRAQLMREISQKLLAAGDLDSITLFAREYLTGRLLRPTFVYTEDPPLSDQMEESAEPDFVFHTKEQYKRVHRLFRIGVSEIERPFDDSGYDVFNFPVVSQNRVLGVIGVACANKPLTQSELIFVQMMAGQLAIALELHYLSAERSRIAVEAEKDQLRGVLLRSISDILRPPLSNILNTSSSILDSKIGNPAETESLVNDIKLDAQWLIRTVENISIITKFSGKSIKVEKKPESAAEIASEAVSIVRKRFPDYIIHLHIPEEPLLVPMDAALISQVLVTLLENAVKNSPDGSLILIDLKKQGNFAEFDISDNGPGIPENLIGSLFEIQPPAKEQVNGDSRGMGIGLSICKIIVQAHNGNISGENRDGQGARFSFRLPLREAEEETPA